MSVHKVYSLFQMPLELLSVLLIREVVDAILDTYESQSAPARIGVADKEERVALVLYAVDIASRAVLDRDASISLIEYASSKGSTINASSENYSFKISIGI